jgi:hypothetical protein
MSKELKSSQFADQFALREKLLIDDAGAFPALDDLYKTVVLDEVGITPEQHKKMQRQESNLFTAVALVGSEQVAKLWAKKPEIAEVGLSYGIGGSSTASFLFNRTEEGKGSIMGQVNYKHDTAEYSRVVKHAQVLFDEVNN